MNAFGAADWGVREKTRESRWERGVWLGVFERSSEIIIGTPEGIVKARTVRRKGSAEESWDVELFNKFTGTPWKMTPEADGENVPLAI